MEYYSVLRKKKKEGNPATGNMGEPGGHGSQCREPVTKGQTVCDSTYT